VAEKLAAGAATVFHLLEDVSRAEAFGGRPSLTRDVHGRTFFTALDCLQAAARLQPAVAVRPSSAKKKHGSSTMGLSIKPSGATSPQLFWRIALHALTVAEDVAARCDTASDDNGRHAKRCIAPHLCVDDGHTLVSRIDAAAACMEWEMASLLRQAMLPTRHHNDDDGSLVGQSVRSLLRVSGRRDDTSTLLDDDLDGDVAALSAFLASADLAKYVAHLASWLDVSDNDVVGSGSGRRSVVAIGNVALRADDFAAMASMFATRQSCGAR
jgi:hypothetical protein